MADYSEDYPVGSIVRIVNAERLEEFRRTWRFHNKLTSAQLAYADRVARVDRVGYYHGGDVLYHLEGVPGIWHEGCLGPADSSNQL